ncbi:MAG: NADH-quinone oxidoreductase subunit C [Bacteroidota bacterium]|nr:NADH-quinone oxidoreductase subunit C [Bacteroidota bacterium]
MLQKDDIISKLKETFASAILAVEDPDGIATFTIASESIIPVTQFLREQLGFNFLTDLCGIHYPDQELPLGVIYHLHNFQENVRVRLKAFVPGENPSIATATDLFPAANWMERETFDFYGIIFEGHPNLKRILNVEYMDYYPMRKEYPLEDPTRHDKEDQFFGR